MANPELLPPSPFTKGTAERKKSATCFSLPGFASSGTYSANFVITFSCFDTGHQARKPPTRTDNEEALDSIPSGIEVASLVFARSRIRTISHRLSAAHHVDGGLAAVFRRNLVSLRAATRTRRRHVGVSRGRMGRLLVGRDSRRIIVAAVAIVSVVSVRRSPISIMPVMLVLGSAAEVASTHRAAEM